MKGERPHYEDGDYFCSVCGEPWDAYGVRIALKGEVSDMTKEEAERFMRGEGCPCCKFGKKTRDFDPERDIPPEMTSEYWDRTENAKVTPYGIRDEYGGL